MQKMQKLMKTGTKRNNMAKHRINTWLISDPHWYHDKVIEFCDRPYKDMGEMLVVMRNNWNKLVGPDDTVICTGDMFMYASKPKMKEYMDSLNGRKILVRGNHDQKPTVMKNCGFDFVCEDMTYIISGERVTFSHYPFRQPIYKHVYFNMKHKLFKLLGLKGTWATKKYTHLKRPKNNGQFLVHGHTHSKNKVNGRMIHIGVDAWNYKPIPLHEIGNLISEIKKNEKISKFSYYLNTFKSYFGL